MEIHNFSYSILELSLIFPHKQDLTRIQSSCSW